ncbi:MAG: hypothetical protein IT442_01080 [Phycisphaeraceae bacterium]|nr:hypothetical protein [Phycisphaeraceae bacterium]
MSAAAISSAGSASTAGSSNAFAAIGSDKFIKILLTELTHQDPFQPQDSSKLMEQLSSLRNIESQMSLKDSMEKLVKDSGENQDALLNHLSALLLQNQISSAGSLIGKQVTGTDFDNQAVAGVVTSVRVEQGLVMLELDNGKSLPMVMLDEFHVPTGTTADTTTDTPPTDTTTTDSTETTTTSSE